MKDDRPEIIHRPRTSLEVIQDRTRALATVAKGELTRKGLHPLWDDPEPFIEVVVADAVRYNWAGIVRACPLALPVAIGATSRC